MSSAARTVMPFIGTVAASSSGDAVRDPRELVNVDKSVFLLRAAGPQPR